ncbi:MAG: YerC/YecD family TrpR-related protein [Oscillospiraceae bacterium]|nr:YerC/YecD family TrpR-related protein [Oscillospiraceae bacterium]
MSIARSAEMDQLFEAILRLETVEECYAFFEDLCTARELSDLSQRLHVAFLLHGGLNYQQVGQQARVSSATICRVKKCLESGSGGYRAAIAKAEEKSE